MEVIIGLFVLLFISLIIHLAQCSELKDSVTELIKKLLQEKVIYFDCINNPIVLAKQIVQISNNTKPELFDNTSLIKTHKLVVTAYSLLIAANFFSNTGERAKFFPVFSIFFDVLIYCNDNEHHLNFSNHDLNIIKKIADETNLLIMNMEHDPFFKDMLLLMGFKQHPGKNKDNKSVAKKQTGKVATTKKRTRLQL